MDNKITEEKLEEYINSSRFEEEAERASKLYKIPIETIKIAMKRKVFESLEKGGLLSIDKDVEEMWQRLSLENSINRIMGVEMVVNAKISEGMRQIVCITKVFKDRKELIMQQVNSLRVFLEDKDKEALEMVDRLETLLKAL